MSDWYQQQLTPSEVYEVNIRLGIIPSTDHAQILVEMKDSMTGILIGQWSIQHAKHDTWRALLERATGRAVSMIEQSIAPF